MDKEGMKGKGLSRGKIESEVRKDEDIGRDRE